MRAASGGMKASRARVQAMLDELKAGATPDGVAKAIRGFRTGPGEYASHDRFIGLAMPKVNAVVKKWRTQMTLADAEELLHSEWHEARMLALKGMRYKFERGDVEAKAEVYACYKANLDRVNNWDLVDISAPVVAGESLRALHAGAGAPWREELWPARRQLLEWVGSEKLWTRRVAVLSTWAFMRKDTPALDPTLEVCQRLLDAGEPEDLMHKAAGWMLRELGKRNAVELERFVRANAESMPRIQLSYCLERTPEPLRSELKQLGPAARPRKRAKRTAPPLPSPRASRAQ